MKKTYVLFLTILLVSFSTIKSRNVKIEIKTEIGSIIAELYPEKAPVTCENILKYIRNDKFENARFYRVVRMDNQPNNNIKIEVIQGGLEIEAEESPYKPILHETTKDTGILHTDGILSMARVEPGTASSEFFICVGNQPELDFGGQRNPDGQGFASFGKVIEGMEIVKRIQLGEDENQMLLDKVEILSIGLLK